jgi:hypothetical protein
LSGVGPCRRPIPTRRRPAEQMALVLPHVRFAVCVPLGVAPGDTTALHAVCRPEWMWCAAYACQAAGSGAPAAAKRSLLVMSER